VVARHHRGDARGSPQGDDIGDDMVGITIWA